jgi:hypothetical protein
VKRFIACLLLTFLASCSTMLTVGAGALGAGVGALAGPAGAALGAAAGVTAAQVYVLEEDKEDLQDVVYSKVKGDIIRNENLTWSLIKYGSIALALLFLIPFILGKRIEKKVLGTGDKKVLSTGDHK